MHHKKMWRRYICLHCDTGPETVAHFILKWPKFSFLQAKFYDNVPSHSPDLTLKHWETHGCVVSTVATDALVLKHQAISILSTD